LSDASSSASFSSLANNEFAVRATGGVRLVTGVDGSGNPIGGVTIAAGDTSWTTVCDQNAKKNFAPVNGQEVLDKLAAVPLEKWNYKWEKDNDVPHIGPMAQAFKAACYPGRDNKSITTLEFDGVELAAIQGLNEKVESGKQKAEAQMEQLVARSQRLETQNADLKARLEKLEQLMTEKLGAAK